MKSITVLSLGAALASSAAAQPTGRLEKIGSTAGDLDVGWIASIAASRTGDLYVADGKAQQIFVYDSTGKRRAVLGRKGAGPLEFRGLSNLAWLADTLVAFD